MELEASHNSYKELLFKQLVQAEELYPLHEPHIPSG